MAQPAALAGHASWALLLVMLASGCAALGYQIVWTQQAALWLGHEGAAALAVVTALFGGLALGAGCLGAAVSRSARPGHWYAACEGVMALWGLTLAWLLEPASVAISDLLGAGPTPAWQATVTFGGIFLLLLPATLAMGATLPAMERLLAPVRAGGTHVAVLYAGNTVGGVLGVLGAAFWWVPQGGLAAATLVCALLNGGCALAVLWWLPARVPLATALQDGPPAAAVQAVPRPRQRPGPALALVLMATGLLGIGYEVVVLRVLSQVAENTIYTFALLLAVYLAGTALGAAAWARWSSGWRAGAQQRRAGLLLAVCLACGLSGGALWLAPWFKALLVLATGGGFSAALVAEALLAVLAFGGPTWVMGALFSHLCEEARAQGMRLGTALALNTSGAALAPLLFGAAWVVGLGAQVALLAVAGGYLALALAVRRAVDGVPPAQAAAPWLAAAALVVALAVAPPLFHVDKPTGATVLSHREGTLGAVSVVQDPAGVRVLRINNRQREGSNTTALADARQALLPLLLHPAPRRALLLGLGTGVTAQAAALDPALQVLAVELLPEVVQAARFFSGVLLDPAQAPNLRVQVADARRFVRASREQWDVIISDNFHPARAGSGALYTVQHFAAVRSRLAPGGLFCQWLPLHQIDPATLRSIVRSFGAVYPHGAALLATNSLQTPVLGLWAQLDAAPLDLALSARRLQLAAEQAAVHERGAAALSMADFGFTNEWALLGSFVAGPAALARFAAGAPLNTDDHPVVSYLAPRATYAPEATPAARLVALLDDWNVSPTELLASDADGAQAARLGAYFKARKQYIAAGVGVAPLADPASMLAQVGQPLLAALQTSPDFLPAYEPLLRLALALRPADAQAAQTLLEELVRLAPAQAGAREALLLAVAR